MNRNPPLRWAEHYPRVVQIGLFLLIAAITAISIFSIERAETERRNAQIQQTAQAVTSALVRQVSVQSSYLRSGAALLATHPTVNAKLFQAFLAGLRLEDNYPDFDGIGWAQKVERSQVPAVEALLRNGRVEAGPIPPPLGSNDQFAVVVMYLAPDLPRDRAARGYNMFSDPVRRAAMVEAAARQLPIATGKLTLLRDQATGEPGFIIYMPVFAEGGRGDFRGFIFSPFNAQRFVAAALRDENLDGAGIALYDGTAEPENLMVSLPTAYPTGRFLTRRLTIASHPWTLRVETPASPALSPMSLVTLLSGLIVATLLVLVARLMTSQAIEDRHAIAWFEEQASIRNSLTQELNHRVKNTLANVLSIIALTRRRATSLDEYARGLDGRIRALSATHDLLTQSEWGTTPIGKVVETELAPYCQSLDRRLDMRGDPVELAPSDALSLGLALHELATNAAKYGALSTPEGRITVHWRLIESSRAELEWIETGGPPVPQERGRGFGTDLIERIVAHELHSPVHLDFAPEGVRCRLRIPVRQPVPFPLREGRGAEKQA